MLLAVSVRAAEEMKRPAHAILNFENRKRWKTERLLSEGTTRLGRKTPYVHLARFRVKAGKRKQVSKLLVWCKQVFLYKIRVTYAKEDLPQTAMRTCLELSVTPGFDKASTRFVDSSLVVSLVAFGNSKKDVVQ